MQEGQDTPENVVIRAGGVSLRKAIGALWLARREASRGAEASSVAYQDGIRPMVFVVLLSGAIELILVDLLLSVVWMRALALTLGVVAIFGLLAFIVALRVYPHRTVNGELTLHYGACFDLAVPLELVATVTRRKGIFDQKRTAAVNDGVLSVPVMGVTNIAITLVSPIQVHLRKTGLSVVREIQVFAVDPSSGVQALRDGERPGSADPKPVGKTQERPLWARALRWAGPLVLLVEVALVTTGLLDWRIAAGIIVVTEGTLAVLGIIAGAVLVSQYRRCRTEGKSRSTSFSQALVFLMPTPMVAMVRMELSIFRVLGLALVRRTEGGRPGDVTMTYGAVSRKVLLGLALLFLGAGTSLLISLATSVAWVVLGFVFLYVALLTAAGGLASSARPHVLRGDILLVRWGMHQELEMPLSSLRSIEVEQRQRGRRSDGASDRFSVPAFGRELVVFKLDEPVAVPKGFGHQRLVETILLPVDEAGTVAGAIGVRGGLSVKGIATSGVVRAPFLR